MVNEGKQQQTVEWLAANTSKQWNQILSGRVERPAGACFPETATCLELWRNAANIAQSEHNQFRQNRFGNYDFDGKLRVGCAGHPY